ncbi:CLUMA_CG020008, isoform A [Clunio marinus]|uniref:CLUMA_CG020008, isoform A n=1 Tax=Clunio marinus TaxID=568069 RepID=A0A1J1J3Q1_9DIPT|nr:CLUMA_CG020008, isoform A [Clunio marinus]
MVHIILLIQYAGSARTKSWAEFKCSRDCVKYICTMYEENLKKANSHLPQITYDISDLYNYIDDLKDMSCMISRDDSDEYIAYDKGWLKMKIFFVLRNEVNVEEEFID